MIFTSLIMAAALTVSSGAAACPKDAAIEARVEKILSTLTIDDKIGQLNQLDGRKDLTKLCAQIRAGQISSVMNLVDPRVTDSLQRIALTESPAGIPLLFARDIVHGFNTVLPIPLAQASSFDDALVQDAARCTALEGTERGIRWAFAPMMDIARDPRWGRMAEGFGEDPFLASRLASAVVRGYQGDSLSDTLSMAACAKHFVAYGAAEGGRDYNTTYVPVRDLYDIYFPPFKACVGQGIASFMCSFNDNDGIPATGNRWLLTEVLRGQWGFDGAVVSDWGSVGALVRHGVAADRKEAARKCLHAGCDMDMESKAYISSVKSLLEEGALTMDELDEAVRRVLRLKVRLGLFEHPYARKAGTSDIYSPEVTGTACRLAEESSVLLKNDGVLPLAGSVRKVLVTGPMADAAYDQLGTWALDGDKTHTVTPLSAIRGNLPEGSVIYEPGLTFPRDSAEGGIRRAVRAARKADVIIAFVGEEQMMTGEAHSLSNLHLQGQQTELLEALAATGKPLVTVFIAGRPLVIGREVQISDAVLYMWHPGTMGGAACSNLLWGKSNPSGRLPVTFPRSEGQIPLYYNHKLTSHKPKGHEGDLRRIPREQPQSVMGHTSSYLDVSFTPEFPFGYGLSYTTFKISDLKVLTPEVSQADGTVKAEVTVTNTGSREGVQTVQAYVTRKTASVTRPVKELKAYRRVALRPGESKSVVLEIPSGELAFCREDFSWGTESGNYTLTIGESSADNRLKAYFRLY